MTANVTSAYWQITDLLLQGNKIAQDVQSNVLERCAAV